MTRAEKIEKAAREVLKAAHGGYLTETIRGRLREALALPPDEPEPGGERGAVKRNERIAVEYQRFREMTRDALRANGRIEVTEEVLRPLDAAVGTSMERGLDALQARSRAPAKVADKGADKGAEAREAQARRVMPLIGPLIDAWEGLGLDQRDYTDGFVWHMDELIEAAEAAAEGSAPESEDA